MVESKVTRSPAEKAVTCLFAFLHDNARTLRVPMISGVCRLPLLLPSMPCTSLPQIPQAFTSISNIRVADHGNRHVLVDELVILFQNQRFHVRFHRLPSST